MGLKIRCGMGVVVVGAQHAAPLTEEGIRIPFMTVQAMTVHSVCPAMGV
jgi:hypothetical protein